MTFIAINAAGKFPQVGAAAEIERIIPGFGLQRGGVAKGEKTRKVRVEARGVNIVALWRDDAPEFAGMMRLLALPTSLPTTGQSFIGPGCGLLPFPVEGRTTAEDQQQHQGEDQAVSVAFSLSRVHGYI